MARGRGGRGRGGQGNRGRGKRNRGPGKSRRKRVSRTKKRVSRKPRSISKSTRRKISSDRRKKRLSKIKNKSLRSRIKSLGLNKKKTETKKKTISASQSRRQVRQKTKDKISTRKKINMPTLGRVGRTLRNIRQPVSGLSSLAIRSVLGRPGIASSIAQAAVNNLGAQNRRKRDMSKLSEQQQRKYQRLSEKTGRDYSIRNPSFRVNMNMRDIAKFAGLDKQGWYNNRVPASIRNAQVNKQFYSNPVKKGWHSSQRTGRGQGLQGNNLTGGVPGSWLDFYSPENQRRLNDKVPLPIPDEMGPVSDDWLGDFYRTYNIGGEGGKLDQSARDYWTNTAKTKGREATMDIIRGTAIDQGTWGGRSKPKRRGRLGRSIRSATPGGLGGFFAGIGAPNYGPYDRPPSERKPPRIHGDPQGPGPGKRRRRRTGETQVRQGRTPGRQQTTSQAAIRRFEQQKQAKARPSTRRKRRAGSARRRGGLASIAATVASRALNK